MSSAVQIFGAVLILAGFALAQFHVLDQRSLTYLVFNLVGSILLAIDADVERQWGFVMLETAWALVSAWGLAVAVRRRRSPSAAP
ncbi:MAG TPA: hypothetical protein VF972_08735 [Actinomycetota bacterium]